MDEYRKLICQFDQRNERERRNGCEKIPILSPIRD